MWRACEAREEVVDDSNNALRTCTSMPFGPYSAAIALVNVSMKPFVAV